MHHPRHRTVSVIAAVLLLAACQDQPSIPTAVDDPPHYSTISATAGQAGQCTERAAESESFRLSHDIPGFGGFSFDDDGNLVAYVTDLAQAQRVHAALTPVLRARTVAVGERRGDQVIVRKGEYGFLQLCAWRDRFFDSVLELEGVVHTGVNQVHNRLNVGVVDAAAEARVRQEVVRLGVPPAAIRFRRASPIVREDTLRYSPYDNSQPIIGATLRSFRRPLEGALQIGFRRPTTPPDHFIPCTMGFNAILNNGLRAVITAAHCSERMWDLDNTSYFQEHPGVGRYIGHETRDPNASSCGFLSPYVCRNSDASAIYIDPGVSVRQGFIARTTGQGSISIDPANERFRIIQKAPHPSGGEAVTRIGQESGWRNGTVRSGYTCEDVQTRHRSWSKLRCQTYASYFSWDGDSGSPVFRQLSGGDVALVGIHWGRESDLGWRVFSSIPQVEQDLGTLQVVDPAYTPPPPPPPPPCEPVPPAVEC